MPRWIAQRELIDRRHMPTERDQRHRDPPNDGVGRNAQQCSHCGRGDDRANYFEAQRARKAKEAGHCWRCEPEERRHDHRQQKVLHHVGGECAFGFTIKRRGKRDEHHQPRCEEGYAAPPAESLAACSAARTDRAPSAGIERA